MKHILENPLSTAEIQKATGAFLDGGRPLHSAVIQQAVGKQQESAPMSIKPAEDGLNGDISEHSDSSRKSPFAEVRSSQEGHKIPSRSSKQGGVDQPVLGF